MAFSMFSSQTSPIAIDFGSSEVKLLQIMYGEEPSIVSAAKLDIPDHARGDHAGTHTFLAEQLPRLIRQSRLKGKKVICSIPSSQTFIRHMQLPNSASDRDEQIKLQLQLQMGWAPGNVVVRSSNVKDAANTPSGKIETICFAVPRNVVMQQIELLKQCKLEVAGVHTEQTALVWAFDHLHRRDNDEFITELYVDLGFSCTKVAISHGKTLVFSKTIEIGGRHFDQRIADELNCDLPTARRHRMALAQQEPDSGAATHRRSLGPMGTAMLNAAFADLKLDDGAEAQAQATETVTEERRSGDVANAIEREIEPGPGPAAPSNVDFHELLDAINDEIFMCLRYHMGLFPGRTVDRVIFLGGESRQTGFCQYLAQAIGVTARVGDPLARLRCDDSSTMCNITVDEAQPGWAVACGLCSGSTQ